ncbi:MAG: CoA pyrophosphatase [Elusimicrobia bacterium]|nr:CoA pyrophosphatase [Elusimicrobiota bacterium]
MPTPDFGTIKARLDARTRAAAAPPGARETAVALILAPGAEGLEALFIRRAERAGDPWSGHIALPGGRKEASDADRLATAVRETSEEVGVELPAERLLGALDDLRPSAPRLPPLVISPYVFGLPRRPSTRLNDEVAGVTWVSLAALKAGAGTAEIRLEGESRRVDCVHAAGLVVWGLTYRILRGFLPLLD